MSGINVTIGENKYTLAFTMDAWARIEEEVCLVDDLGEVLTGKGRVKATMRIFAILAGCELDELKKCALPVHMRAMTQAIWKAINDGMHMETERGGDREVDVTLEEIEKKEEPAV